MHMSNTVDPLIDQSGSQKSGGFIEGLVDEYLRKRLRAAPQESIPDAMSRTAAQARLSAPRNLTPDFINLSPCGLDTVPTLSRISRRT
jgi:hypothetical protein